MKLINGDLPDTAAIDCHCQHCADGQVDAVDRDAETATAAILHTILGSSARRHPIDGCACERCVEPEIIAENAHKAAERIGWHRSPDNRTYQRRQEHAKPAISVKVT